MLGPPAKADQSIKMQTMGSISMLHALVGRHSDWASNVKKTWSQVPKVRFPIHVPATVFSRDIARSLQVPRVKFLTHVTAGLLSRDIASALHVAVQPPHSRCSPTKHRQTHRTRSSNYHGVEFSAHHILVPKCRTRKRPPRFHLTRCPVVCLQHLTTRACEIQSICVHG